MTEADPRIELEEYKKNYLEALKNLDPTSILDDQEEAKKFAKNSKCTFCKSCYLFGCYDSPKADYESIVVKRDIQDFEEDPSPDDAQDKALFNIDIDQMNQSIFKKPSIDPIVGFHHFEVQEDSPIQTSNNISNQSIGEKEFLNVETWNKILSIGGEWNTSPLSSSLTDLEISVYDSLKDDALQEDLIQTFGEDMEPGDTLTLNMANLKKMSMRSTYRPLPIYYFDHAKLTLKQS